MPTQKYIRGEIVMILKEIDMTIPYIEDESIIREIQNEKGLEYAEAKKEYQTGWKWERRKFQLLTRCMTSMVERMMPRRIKTKDFWKIIIEWVEKPKKGFKSVGGVCEIQIKGNVKEFYQVDDYMKKQIVIDKIIEAIKILSEMTDIDIKSIEETCFEVRKLNYINEWMWRKPVKSTSGFAQIKVQHTVREVVLSMVFFDLKKNVIKQVPLISTDPDEWAYAHYLGELRWESDKEAVLIARTGESFSVMI